MELKFLLSEATQLLLLPPTCPLPSHCGKRMAEIHLVGFKYAQLTHKVYLILSSLLCLSVSN